MPGRAVRDGDKYSERGKTRDGIEGNQRCPNKDDKPSLMRDEIQEREMVTASTAARTSEGIGAAEGEENQEKMDDDERCEAVLPT